MVIGGILLAVLMAGGLIALNAFGDGGGVLTAGLAQPGATLGSAGAPVTMEEFSDFQCPFCGQFARQTSGKIIDEYVKTGKVRFVYRHFAFIGQESIWAGQAAECAGSQNRFWEYHDKLFASQAGENRGAFSRENLKRFARELGLDAGRFDRCLDNNETLERVRQDTEEGMSRQVRSTPTFFINDDPLLGALPYENFKTAIDRQLPR